MPSGIHVVPTNAITPIELEEARYNAKDVLCTCRIFPLLDADLDKHDVRTIYNVDEQMADLALQMTRAGMPINSDKRAAIAEKLLRLCNEAIDHLRPYTEGENFELFAEWVARYMAAKARKFEPVAGSTRLGPTQATADLVEAQGKVQEWLAYRKQWQQAVKDSGVDQGDIVEAEEIENNLIGWRLTVIERKRELLAAQFDSDEFTGLPHTNESAFEARMQIRKAEFAAKFEKHGVNFGAKVQQAAILRVAGVPLMKVTEKTGLPQIDKEVLKGLERHSAAKYLLQYILVEKTLGMYVRGEDREEAAANKSTQGGRAFTVSEDGYCHPSWQVHKITGRWGSSPNVQNFSKRAGGGAENIRAMIEAPEGYTFIGADQAQLEARLLGAMSSCKYMIETFRRNEDIHSAFALVGFPSVWPRIAEIFKLHKKEPREIDPGKPNKCICVDCKMRDQLRDVTKRLEYGGFYGGAEQTLWESVVGDFPDFQLGQARTFLQEFNRRLPEVLAWREQTLREATLERCIRSPILGRRQVFPLGRVDPTVAYNYKAQSGGADLWALGAIDFCAKWDQTEFDVRLIHNGHDSVLVLCKEELVEEVKTDVYGCWSREWGGVPFIMETKSSYIWSEV